MIAEMTLPVLLGRNGGGARHLYVLRGFAFAKSQTLQLL